MATIVFDTSTFKETDYSKSLCEFLLQKEIYCSVYITSNGKLVQETDLFEDGRTYRIIPRVLGGKGGFGSMLRSIGAQIEKTTNREACRDLSGRRMRDVNNEQQLRDWVAQKAAREKEREKRRQERAEKRRHALTEYKHHFDDPNYHSQKMLVLERLDEALRQGFLSKKSSSDDGSETTAVASPVEESSTSQPSTSATKKRKAAAAAVNESDEETEVHTKRACEWLGIDMKDLSGLDSGSDDSSSNQSDTETSSNKATNSEAVVKVASNSDVVDRDGKESQCEAQSDSGQKETTTTDEQGIPLSKQEERAVQRDSGQKVGLLDQLKGLPPKEENSAPQGPVNLEDYSSAVELESCGLDRLKTELMSMGLKCGGTLQQRAERLWAVKGKSKEEIDPSFFAKPGRNKKK